MSVVALYTLTEIYENEEKMFHAKLDSPLDQCPYRDALIVLSDFNAVTGTERAGYMLYIGSHSSATGNDKSSCFLNLARS